MPILLAVVATLGFGTVLGTQIDDAVEGAVMDRAPVTTVNQGFTGLQVVGAVVVGVALFEVGRRVR